MKRITKIEANEKLQSAPKKLRVAAYARVSTDSREQLVSLEAQKSHYETSIKSNPDWEYVGLYYDEGVSGTSMAKRDGLLKMLDDCEAGKMDFIIIKSISRFARNTTECLEAVRKLIRLKVFIYFEKEPSALCSFSLLTHKQLCFLLKFVDYYLFLLYTIHIHLIYPLIISLPFALPFFIPKSTSFYCVSWQNQKNIQLLMKINRVAINP